jgi:hypothetical protein
MNLIILALHPSGDGMFMKAKIATWMTISQKKIT